MLSCRVVFFIGKRRKRTRHTVSYTVRPIPLPSPNLQALVSPPLWGVGILFFFLLVVAVSATDALMLANGMFLLLLFVTYTLLHCSALLCSALCTWMDGRLQCDATQRVKSLFV